MAIASSDIGFYPCATTAEGVSHGGAIVTSAALGTGVNALFDNVSGAEAAAGAVNFRKAFVMLGSGAGASVLSSPVLWMTDLEGSTAERVYYTTLTNANQSDLPSTEASIISTAWAHASVKSLGITLASMSSGSANAIAIWQCRVVDAGCGAVAADRIDFKIEGDTA